MTIIFWRLLNNELGLQPVCVKFNENITEYDAQIPFPLTLIRGNDHLGRIHHPQIRRLSILTERL